MPNSLRSRLNKLVYKGLLSEEDLKRIIITNPMSIKEECSLLSNVYNEGFDKGYEKAKAKYKPKKCDDAVSRQVIKEQMLKYGFHAPDMTVTEFVEDLPSVTHKREQGEWLNKQITDDYHVMGTCSLCHERNRIGKACRSCGALMR